MKDLLVSFLATGGIATAWFAQLPNVDTGILSLIGNGITVVVLAWYVIYDVRVRTPGMFAVFTREQDELRKAFKAEQADSRETWTKTIETLRSTFQAEQAALRQENRDDRAIIRLKHAEEIAEWRKMVNDNMNAMRTAVHDVRSTAQLAITRGELTATIPKGTGDPEGASQPGRPG